MRILGVELSRELSSTGAAGHALVLLGEDGRVAQIERVASLPEVAAGVGNLAGGEPFLLGVDIPVVVPAKPVRARAVEGLLRRRFGFRLPPGGRAALSSEPLGVAGEALLAGLAAAGLPCLPYPDRDRRKSGLGETHPELTLKALLWTTHSIEDSRDQTGREELFRAYGARPYRAAKLPARISWAAQAATLELMLRALGEIPGFDFRPTRDALGGASTDQDVDWAGAVLDATLIAGTVRRYLEAPEHSLFLGDQDGGYLILPADPFIRRLALADSRPQHGALFPNASLRERLGRSARVRAVDLLNVPGRPQRVEATFTSTPRYEFDNLDEMMWWKHCRHLAGPRLPTEGLHELVVDLGSSETVEERGHFRLVRSRHRTLSFRFDPPGAWRTRVPTRDGKTYPFHVVRAVYETLPSQE